MKAAIYTQYGPPSVLRIEEINKPEPKDDEILVRVRAATVNRTDCANLRASPSIMRLTMGLFKPRKTTPGTDFAGQVEAVGKEVAVFKEGDNVFGFNDSGLRSHAQYLVISERKAIAAMPENITYEQASASLEGFHYARNFVNKVDLKSECKVLINGATGAIGVAALQLVKYYGAYVTAVCNAKNIALVRSLGADRVIDYLTEDFTKDEERYNFVFDTVGKSSFGKCKPLLKPGGVYISSELGWMSQNIFFALTTPVFGGKKVAFPLPVDIKASILLVKQLIQKGKFKAVIDRTYPLEEIVEAFTYVETGQKTGNVVLKM